jgi:hypothetical protein
MQSSKILYLLITLSLFILGGCGDEETTEVMTFGGMTAQPSAGSNGMQNGDMPTGGTVMNQGGTVMNQGGTMTPTGGMNVLPGGTMGMMGGVEVPSGGTQAPVGGVEMNMGGMEMGGGVEPQPILPVDCSAATVEVPCDVSVYQARSVNIVADEVSVRVRGVITAIRINDDGAASHLVIQDPIGGDFSGIWVYVNDAEVDPLPVFAEGAEVEMTASTADYFGQRQLQQITAVTQLGGNSSVQPITVTPTDIKTGGGRAMALEGVLVRVQNVSVESLNPPAGPGDEDPTQEIVISGGLRINDFFTPLPMVNIGDTFTEIIGVLRFGNGDYKIEPRRGADIER